MVIIFLLFESERAKKAKGSYSMEIPGFEIIERIGQGSMGVVCKVHQKSLERTVAIKILKPEISKDPIEVESFIREARTAASLKQPNIVQVYDVAQINECPYIVMELINGPTVGQLMRTGSLSQKQALEITLAVASALQYAWNHAQLIHRDIKPHNIMVDADGTIKLSDLGMAKRMTDHAATSDHKTHLLGTPNYMSPEQAAGAPMDMRSDMYSLGATLYHMLTGRIPFEGLPPEEIAKRQISDQLTNPRNINPSVSIGATQLVTKLMMKDPNRRFHSWSDVISTVKKVSSGRISLRASKDTDGSTIARPNQAPGATPQNARGGIAALKSVPNRRKAPAQVTLATASILLVLWSGLAFYRLRLPPAIPYPERPNNSSIHKPAPQKTAPSRPLPARAENGTHTQTPLTQPVTPEPAGEERSTIAEQQKTEDQINALLRNTLHALSVEDFNKAKATLTGNTAAALPTTKQAKLREIHALIDQMKTIPSEIEEAFRSKLGTKVPIVIDGQKHTILMTSLAGGKIYGTTQDAAGNDTSISFDIAKLSSEERCRWIPTTDDPAHHTLKCVLLIKNGHTKKAQAHAPKCGPLADLLTRLLASRHGG